jgi:two-component system, OmpR family, sensor histidine kinase TctE
MMHANGWTLRQRLLLAILIPLIVVSAIGAVLDYRLARETTGAAFDHSLAEEVYDISSRIQATDSALEVKLSDEMEAMLRSDALDSIFFSVRDNEGNLLAGDASLSIADDFPSLRTGAVGKLRFVNTVYRDLAIRAVYYRARTERGIVAISVGETLNKRNRASSRILTTMALPSIAVILATIVAVYFGVRKGLVPLDVMEREIASRSPKDLRKLDIGTAPRELRSVILRLNDLFELLQEAAASQQRFVADAAHQLRTPLTGLQTQIELASAEGHFDPNSDRLHRIGDAIERIAHLVDQLLLYARTDPSSHLVDKTERVALHELVEQSASSFLDQAIGRGIDLGFEPNAAFVEGRSWMIREALANLIDNALRYTPAGGVVTVACSSEGQRCRLSVEDSGPGIPLPERDRVFNRFYRMAGTKGDGCGLGLAIVKEVANLHDATVELSDPPGGGLRASIVFTNVIGPHRGNLGGTLGGSERKQPGRIGS